MQLYSQLQVLSTKLIKQFGVPCTVITSRNWDYDPSTGAMQTIKTEKSAYCLFDNLAYDFPSFQSGGSGESSSTMVKQGDVLIYVTSQADPELNAQIIVNSENWQVIKSQPIKPANQAIIYQCQCRRVE